MGLVKSTTVTWALVQYADEIDNSAAAGHEPTERRRIMNVGID